MRHIKKAVLVQISILMHEFLINHCTSAAKCGILLFVQIYCEVFFMQPIPQIAVGDIIEMKKPHPCSDRSTKFRVLRIGSDIRIVCEACGRDLTVPRIKLEKNIRRVIHENTDNS